jgi:outer membrane lipoprotein SlyB
VLRALLLGVGVLVGLTGCKPDYSPNTYSSTAVQQAAKVDQGVVVGVREVAVSANTSVGTVTGAAAGGIAGSQIGGGVTGAFGALGGGLVGGLAGSAAEHVQGDTRAFEYIVRKTTGGDLISVTQKDDQPLALGQHVLVISGQQARIVPDYTTPEQAAKGDKLAQPPTVPVPVVPPPVAVPIPPAPPAPVEATPDPPASVQAAPIQAAPSQTAPTQAAPVQAGPVQPAPIRAAPLQAAPSPASSTPAGGPSATAPTPLMLPSQTPAP